MILPIEYLRLGVMERTLRPQREVVKATYGTHMARPPGFGYDTPVMEPC
jgi:hypothetical protein